MKLTPIHRNKAEVWDEEKCQKMANHRAKDGLGTPYPFKGYIGSTVNNQYGLVRYNGGCVRNNKWYAGEKFPLPKIPKTYKIIIVPTWGYRIVPRKTRKNCKRYDIQTTDNAVASTD